MIAQIVVQLGAGLHEVDHLPLRALGAQALIDLEGGRVHGAKGRQRIQGHADTGRGQFPGREQGRLAKLGDIGQHRGLDGLGKLLILGQTGHGLGKDHIGAGLHTGGGAINRGGQPLHRQRVGPGHDHKIGIGPRVNGRLDPVHHLRPRHNGLVGPVSAAFLLHLILNMRRRRARPDQGANRAGDIKGPAPAGVNIDQRRQAACLGNTANIDEDIFQRGDAEIRQAAGSGRHAAAGDIQGKIAGRLGQPGMIGIDRAHDLQRPFPAQRRAKTRPRRYSAGLTHRRPAPPRGCNLLFMEP